MKYILFVFFVLTISAYSQFSSKIDYNKKSLEAKVNEYAGISIFGNNSTADWTIDYYESEASSIKNQFKAGISSTTLGISAFYFKEFSSNFTLFSNLDYLSINKTSDLNIVTDSLASFSIPSIDLQVTSLKNNISLWNDKISLLSAINLLKLKANNNSSNSFETSFGITYKYQISDKANLTLHYITAFYDDNYKTDIAPKIKAIYTLIPKHNVGFKYNLKNDKDVYIISYNLFLYLDTIFEGNNYSNIEIGYERKFTKSFSITTNFGTNFDFDPNYLSKPIPLYYYSLGIKNSFLKNKVEIEFLWTSKMIKIKINDDYYLKSSNDITGVDFKTAETDFVKNKFQIFLKYNIR